jgi:hypothetical protein
VVRRQVAVKPYPKSRAGRRTVPLAPFLLDALTEHRELSGPRLPVRGMCSLAHSGSELSRSEVAMTQPRRLSPCTRRCTAPERSEATLLSLL